MLQRQRKDINEFNLDEMTFQEYKLSGKSSENMWHAVEANSVMDLSLWCEYSLLFSMVEIMSTWCLFWFICNKKTLNWIHIVIIIDHLVEASSIQHLLYHFVCFVSRNSSEFYTIKWLELQQHADKYRWNSHTLYILGMSSGHFIWVHFLVNDIIPLHCNLHTLFLLIFFI